MLLLKLEGGDFLLERSARGGVLLLRLALGSRAAFGGERGRFLARWSVFAGADLCPAGLGWCLFWAPLFFCPGLCLG